MVDLAAPSTHPLQHRDVRKSSLYEEQGARVHVAVLVSSCLLAPHAPAILGSQSPRPHVAVSAAHEAHVCTPSKGLKNRHDRLHIDAKEATYEQNVVGKT